MSNINSELPVTDPPAKPLTCRRNRSDKGNVRVTLRLPPELKDALAKEACALRIGLNTHVINKLKERKS